MSISNETMQHGMHLAVSLFQYEHFSSPYRDVLGQSSSSTTSEGCLATIQSHQ
jgi:hypothetical protein